MLGAIFEDEDRARARRKHGHPPERAGFTVCPARIAEPVRGDAKLRQRLLEDPVAAIRRDSDRTTRDAARENAHDRILVGVDEAASAKPGHEVVRPLDVEPRRHGC